MEQPKSVINKMRQSAAEIGNKTKIAIEISRLQTHMAQKEKEAQGKYISIGETIYLSTTGDVDEELAQGNVAALCEEITGILNEVKMDRLRIQELNGLKTCPNADCQAEIPANHNFCPVCGTDTRQTVDTVGENNEEE